MTSSSSKPVDQDIYDFVSEFVDTVPFTQLMGYELTHLETERVVFTLPMRNALVGNYIAGNLHGGVISSLIDMTGGILAMVAALNRGGNTADPTEKMARVARSGTIDMRVDYLRPGRGETFTCTANLLRCGKKVAVVRSELKNEQDDLIAVGTASYLCG